MAEPNDEIPKINPSEVEILINKIELSDLDEQDKHLISKLLRTSLTTTISRPDEIFGTDRQPLAMVRKKFEAGEVYV